MVHDNKKELHSLKNVESELTEFFLYYLKN